MTAYILEKLFSNGWRRTPELYWRKCDAEDAGQMAIRRDKARAIRILEASIGTSPICEIEAPPVRSKSKSLKALSTNP